jgi:hypothetical protein
MLKEWHVATDLNHLGLDLLPARDNDAFDSRAGVWVRDVPCQGATSVCITDGFAQLTSLKIDLG